MEKPVLAEFFITLEHLSHPIRVEKQLRALGEVDGFRFVSPAWQHPVRLTAGHQFRRIAGAA
jgi:hypothetical protein